jgi:hypothetical protein
MPALLAMLVGLTVDTDAEQPTGGSIMEIRIAQAKLWPSMAAVALVGLALTLASSPAAAQQWTPEQRAACEPDAMRLCQAYIPDVDRVRGCMAHYRRYLSPRCRALFEGGAKKRRS